MKESYPSLSLGIALSHNVPQKPRRKCPGYSMYRLRLSYRCSWEIARLSKKECPSCSRSTYYPLLHYILECEMMHNHFGPHMDVNDPGTLKEAASSVKITMKDQQALTTFLVDHPVPR